MIPGGNQTRCDTASAFLDTSLKWKGQATAVVCGNDAISAAQLRAAVNRVAGHFARAGIPRGGRVMFFGRNTIEFLIAYLGAQRAGLVCCPIHVREDEGFFRSVVTLIAPAAIVAGTEFQPVVDRLFGADDRLLRLCIDGSGDGAWRSLADWFGQEAAPPSMPAPEDACALVLSSGSTGTPKAVIHTQASICATLRATNIYGGLDRATRFLIFVSTSFAAWLFQLLPTLANQGTAILLPTFHSADFCRAVQDHRVNITGLVPSIIRSISDAEAACYDLSSLERAVVGGEVLAASDAERMRRWSRDVEIRCLYLAAESGPGAATFWRGADLAEHGKEVCAGLPVAGADMRVVRVDGGFDDVVAPGEVGEIILRGDTLAAGYWGDDERTARCFRGGWWRSGDLGSLDEDGFLAISGRVDNLINTGGIKVHAEEIETAILAHPDVVQAAVIGLSDPRWGQRIHAAVVASAALDQESLIAHLRANGMSSFKLPKTVEFCDSLPHGATGKIDRKAFHQMRSGNSL